MARFSRSALFLGIAVLLGPGCGTPQAPEDPSAAYDSTGNEASFLAESRPGMNVAWTPSRSAKGVSEGEGREALLSAAPKDAREAAAVGAEGVPLTLREGDTLPQGTVALVEGTCSATAPLLQKRSAACGGLSFDASITGVALGPKMQLLLSRFLTTPPQNIDVHIADRRIHFYKNNTETPQVYCFSQNSLPYTLTGQYYFLPSSTIVTAESPQTCELERIDPYCAISSSPRCSADDFNWVMAPSYYTSSQKMTFSAPTSLIVTSELVSPKDRHCCTMAYSFAKGSCGDLGLIGLKNHIASVSLPVGTALALYTEPDTTMVFQNRTDDKATVSDCVQLATNGITYCPPSSATSLSVTENTGLAVADLLKTSICGIEIEKQKETNCDLRGADFSGRTLDDKKLSHANLSEANLRISLLRRVDLSGATLRRITADGVAMIDCTLASAALFQAPEDAAINRAKLTNAYFANVDFSQATLTYADFTGSVFDGLTATTSPHITFDEDSTLANAVFDNSLFLNATISGPILDKTSFRNVGFFNSVFSLDSQSNNTTFEGSTIFGCDFSAAGDWSNSNFNDVLFSFSQISNYPLNLRQPPETGGELRYDITPLYIPPMYNSMMPNLAFPSITCPNGLMKSGCSYGGESPQSCPDDCSNAKPCSEDWNCANSPVDVAGMAFGLVKCDRTTGLCRYDADPKYCGNRTCDWLLGETVNSCPLDCFSECQHGAQCVAKHWPLSLGGHWDCDSGLCKAKTTNDWKSGSCGDTLCNMNGDLIPNPSLRPPPASIY